MAQVKAVGGQRRAAQKSAGYRLRGRQGVVIDTLGRGIVAGLHEPGKALPGEAVLMEQFDVSRTLLREAIKVLAAKGLVETRQRVGTVVRPPHLWNAFDSDLIGWHHQQGKDAKIFRDLVELRLIIEPAAASLAAIRASQADRARITERARAMMQAVRDPVAYSLADVAFHLAVFEASDNLLITSFANIVGDFLRMSFELQQNALNDSDNRIEDDAAGHMAVAAAIGDADADGAARAMRALVLNAQHSLSRALAGDK